MLVEHTVLGPNPSSVITIIAKAIMKMVNGILVGIKAFIDKDQYYYIDEFIESIL